MSKNLFPLLEFREEKLELDKYDDLISLKFPPIYRAFLSNFKTESKNQ